MRTLLSLALISLCCSLSAQETITYPYNPDGDADGLVAVPDIQDLLAVYGSPFSPAEIMVGDTALSEWIQILYQALQDQQEVIEAMQEAGGCDVRFPDGLDGEYFTTLLRDADMNDYPYSVPSGKTLYVTNVYAGGTIGKLLISNNNGGASAILAGSNFGNSDYGHSTLHNPIIVNEGQTLSGYGNTGVSVSIHGFLVDYGVVPITWNEGGYQVPANKRLYVLNVRGDLYVDDILISYASGQRYVIGHPIVINSSQVVSVGGSGSVNDGGTVNGYLVDEDYFADCGGGGFSTTESSTSWNSSVPFLQSSSFPQGRIGESVTIDFEVGISYTVPSGKNLYIHDDDANGSPEYTISDNVGNSVFMSQNYPATSENITFGEGFTITLTSCALLDCNDSWKGILIDKQYVEAVMIVFSPNSQSYSVPSGKVFVGLSANDFEIGTPSGEWSYNGYVGPTPPSYPIEENVTITYLPNESNPTLPSYMFGYLMNLE